MLAEKIHEVALQCGYAACGIIPLEAVDDYRERMKERISKIPHSDFLYGLFKDSFCNLKKDYPWAESIVICSFWYGKYRVPESLIGKYAKLYLLSFDSVPDAPEHQKLLSLEKWFNDNNIKFAGGETNAPAGILPLRPAAVAAGLGIFRKNNFFYGEKGSSYYLVGYLIDKRCEYTENKEFKPCPEKCTLCQKACRTKALQGPYTMDPISCVSFLNTFGQSVVPSYLKEEQMGEWILGCDDCQDACPYNKQDWSVGDEFPELADVEQALQVENVLKASDEDLLNIVIPRSASHLKPEQTEVIRISARRSLKNRNV